MEDLQGTVGSPSAAAAPSWFPAETAIEAAPAPVAVEAPLPPEERTYEGVSREEGMWVVDIKFDGEEIKRLGTYENAGAAAWAYDAAREERGLPPVNFPLPGQAPAPTTEAPAPAEDAEAVPPVTTAAEDEREQAHQSVAVPPAPERSEAAPPPALPAPARKPHVASAASAWAGVCTDLLAALEDQSGIVGIRDRLVSDGFRCVKVGPKPSEYHISVPATYPCYYDVAGKDYSASQDMPRTKPQLVKYFEGCLDLARTGGAYRTEADREADEGEDARRAATKKLRPKPPVTTAAVEPVAPDATAARPETAVGQRVGRARTKPERLTDLVDAGKTYAARPSASRTRNDAEEAPAPAPATEPVDEDTPAPVSVPRFKHVYPPNKTRVSWTTCVHMGGGSVSAGSHATQEAAARAVDAMLLAHRKKAVNFPGDEEATRAAFPDIIATRRAPASRRESRPAAAARPKPRAARPSAPSKARTPKVSAAAPAETPSRKRPRSEDDAAAENERLRRELDSLRAATQSLEQDLRAAEAQRDEARGDADQLRGDVKRLRSERDEARGDAKRLRRERDEARKDAATSERALAALRQKLDRQMAAQREATPARPAKRGRHHYSPAEEPVDDPQSENRRDAPGGSGDAWPVVGSHVQRGDGLRGVVTKLGYNGQTEVTTKTGYAVTVYCCDLTTTTLSAEEAALCDRSRLTPNEWVQAQLDGAICATYKGREFGNCFATKDGRTQRTFTVESNGDVRCALCDWTAPSGASRALQSGPLAEWTKWVASIKQHSGHYASQMAFKTTRQHIERVLAMAAEPSTQQRPPAHPSRPSVKPSTGPRPDPRATAQYSVESLVEARFRGGDVFYPALVVAVRDGGRTLDLKYTDGDSEERVPLDLVRPLAARQRSAPAAAVPEAPPAAPTSKPEAAAPRWTAEEEKQLRKLVNELGDRESWSAIAARLGSQRSGPACEWHWKYSMMGGTIMAAPPAPKAVEGAITDEFSGMGWRQLTELMRTRGIGRDPYDGQDDFRRKLRAHKAGNPAPPPSPVAPTEDAIARAPTSSVSYPVDALVEARWRGGSKFYPALVLATSGATVDLKYVDDSDEEDDVPVELVRPANRRLLQRYQELTGKRTPPPVILLPQSPPPPSPSSPQFAKGSKCIVPWSDGRKYAATVVSSGPTSARVAFEDGALKTVPLEELEPLSTPTPVHPTSQQPKSSRTGSRTERVTDNTALEAKMREDNWTISVVPRPPGKDGGRAKPDKYYHKPGESKQYRSLLGVARAHYPEFVTGDAKQRFATGGIRCTSGRPDCYCKGPRSTAIVRYDSQTGAVLEEFCSVGAAADKLDICISKISKNLSGKTSTAEGHVFRYKTPPPPKKKIPEALPVEAPPPPPPPPLPTDPCAICMSTITEDACVLECGHAFHAACLGDLADHVRLAAPTRRSLGVSCPLCRKTTRAEVGE